MTNNLSTVSELNGIDLADLGRVVGGAGNGVDFNAIKDQARPYCPNTVARYQNVNPATITRQSAQQMASSCLAEMGPLRAGFARGRINAAIDQAFPPPARGH